MTAATPITTAPPSLWAAADALLQAIFALFGAPEIIAARHTLTHKNWTLLGAWLRAGEALMRRLLLIEAAHYAKPNTRPLLKPRRVRRRRLVGFSADAPEAWRVSFRCLLDRQRRAGETRRGCSTVAGDGAGGPRDRWHASRWPTPKFHSAWPLAERAEALLRVFNDPAPYARRLAARLHATPHRAAALTRHPPNLPHTLADAEAATLDDHTAIARRRFESG